MSWPLRIYWAAIICGFFASMLLPPSLYRSVLAAVEYWIVGCLIFAAVGFGRMIRDHQHESGTLTALGGAAAAVVCLGAGIFFISISLKPGFPFYVLTLTSGRGACLAIICAAVYGFLAQKQGESAPTGQYKV
jgi:hypothetical protein